MVPVTVLGLDGRPTGGEIDGDRVLVEPDVLEAATGWHLEERGLCRAEACVPVRDRERVVAGERVDVAGVAGLLGLPLVVDAGEGVAAVGEAAERRGDDLISLVAPDFTLDDLDGRPVSLSDFRGEKVLLLAWASW